MRSLCLVVCLFAASEATAGKTPPALPTTRPVPRFLPTVAARLVPLPTPDMPVAELVAELQRVNTPEARDRITRQLAGASALDKTITSDLVSALDGADEPGRDVAAWVLGHHGALDCEGKPLYDSGPKVLEQERPEMPQGAFVKGISGIVSVEVVIGASGNVDYAEVRESIPALDAAALACVKKWRFEPAQRHGKPSPILATAPVSFRLME